MDIQYLKVDRYSEVDTVTVGIKRISKEQAHVAIIYKFEDRLTRLLHLAWHKSLLVDDLAKDRGYSWMEIPLDPVSKSLIAANCEVIITRNDRESITYGFESIADQGFDARTGEYFSKIDSKGLTCSSFIIAVFKSLEINLLRTETWQQRKEDKVWMEKIVNELEFNRELNPKKVSVEHLKNLKSQINRCVRYKPEEVASASYSRDMPLDFKTAEIRGKELISRVEILN